MRVFSAESGIKTFRASDGLWEDHAIEDVATPEGFRRNPSLVHKFYNARRRQLSSVQPNKAHKALAEFEYLFEGDFLLITQNVDDLHERAGSKNLIHMHGELLKGRCQLCEQVFFWDDDMSEDSICPGCSVIGSIRPHIVWFHEMPIGLGKIYDALAHCDLFMAIGTSGHVYPAAGFYEEAITAGAWTVELNLGGGTNASLFDERVCGSATNIVPKYLQKLLI